MPALFFPNLTALRLALGSGLVPLEFTRIPAAAGFDTHGRLWLELAELPPRESLAALARVGVQVLGGTGVATERVNCWAELLPLSRATPLLPGMVLFLLPDRAFAKFLARIRRSKQTALGVCLRDDAGEQRAWVAVPNPPLAFLDEADAPGTAVEAFTEQIPGVWVRHGWQHPLPEHLVRQPGHLLLVRPPRAVMAIAGEIPAAETGEFPLRTVQRRSSAAASLPASVPIRVSLASRPSPERESFWVLDATHAAQFWAFCASADERLTHRLEAGHVTRETQSRLVVRITGKRGSVILPMPVIGYTPDSRVPGLFVPADRVLRPNIRLRELTRALRLGPDRLVWLEPGADGGVVPNAIPLSVFRPVANMIDYTAPAAVSLSIAPRAELFPLARLPVIQNETVPEPRSEPLAHPMREAESRETHPRHDSEATSEPGWFLRSVRRFVARLRPSREPPTPVHPPTDQPLPDTSSTERRVERKLASPDALLHGHDWAARRRELEVRLFRELPSLGPEGRAARWADLAVVYATTANPADAAVCWMNAAWESPNPSMAWLEQWFAAECRAAKITDHANGLERTLSEPGRTGVGRVVAAYTAWAGFAPNPPPEFPAALPRILAFLEQHFDDLPVRAAWLARLAATRLCDGDALGLARWRDRVLARLADRGPGLDLDEPSFLRFHGTASADRFQTARDWLRQVHDPALKWIRAHGGGRLRWPGLDAETESTAAYARFMLAWGLGCLGERMRAKEWATGARKSLPRTPGPGVDAAGHAVLGDLFLHRVKDAQEGRPAKPGLPAELHSRVDALSFLARYAVNRLREHSRILEPLDRVQAFGGLDLKVFWGNDRLGERLFVLAERADLTHPGDEAEALLQLCAESPGTTTIPRVVLTLLEVAPRLDPPIVLRLLDLLPTALDWMEAWLSAGRWTDDERPARLVRFQARVIEAGFLAAGSLMPGMAGPAIGQLVRRLLSMGVANRQPLLAVTASVFRSMRRLGLRGEAETLMRFLDPGEKGTLEDARGSPVTRLGLAIGWFTAGNEDTGNHIIDEARDQLYLAGDSDVRGRTELAIAYAEALGFAPPQIAHGRLEEIFQRLGKVRVEGGTNRYFTLKPLQLIDAIVRSVVTDEFTLGPAVRGWLDDDEFLIRGRIHRDLAAVLREQGIG